MFQEAFDKFLAAANAKVARDYAQFGGPSIPKLSAEPGKRYVRVVTENYGQRSAWCFVDTTNGDVLKCDGWKRPAKHARGNIYDDKGGLGRVQWTGVR
jgi:hypothetical protein